jgi:hypothetical protein
MEEATAFAKIVSRCEVILSLSPLLLALARFLTKGQSSLVSERHCATVATESLLHRGNSLLLLIDPALRARARLTIMPEAARSAITKTSRSHNYKQFH